ncbi:MAG: hypothetical protein AB4911_22060 [Oscillochloridaceae bacterium umkhey_bin13]
MPSLLRCLLALILLVVTLLPVMPPASAAPPAQAPAAAFGINSHLASRHPVFETLPAAVDAVASLGVGIVREDFQLSRIRPMPDRSDWGWHDRVLDLYAARGIEVIGVLNGPTPGWMVGQGGASFTPPSPELFAQFAQAAASRYRGRIRYWQIWNEPDNARYWQPGPNPAAYAALLRAAYPAIKAADPSAQVLAAGLVSPQPAASFLQQLHANGAWNAFDIIALHPYTDPLGPEEGQIGGAGIGAVQGLAQTLGPKPIWATEFGWSTGPADRLAGGGAPVDEATQAAFLVRGATLLRAAGAERVIWYTFKDTAPTNLYGVVRADPSQASYAEALRKPAARALQVLTSQLAGAGAATTLDLSPPVTVLDFEQMTSWRRGDQPNGTLTPSGERVRSGRQAARLDYNFPNPGNDFVVFLPPAPVNLPANTSQLGLWVFGDGSGHALRVWLRDSQGEVLQYRLGPVGGPNWQLLQVPLTGEVAPGNVISGARNRRLDLPATLTALVLDDDPDGKIGGGTIFLDDLVAFTGASSYGVRFAQGGEVVDVLWAPNPTEVALATRSGQATVTRLGGEQSSQGAPGGQLGLGLGPAPIYVRHQPGDQTAPAPAPAPAPQPPAPPQPAGDQRCFAETNQCMSGRIREYWEQNGGLPVFGFPVSPLRTEVIEGRELQVQWFERNRLELHPENARPYDVLLGRLGADVLAGQGRDWRAFPQTGPQPGCRYFAETGQSVCGAILAAWRANGLELDGRPGKTEAENLALFGLPLSGPTVEIIEGRQLTVQWFERARFELHPENAPPFNVLLGLLGNELTRR